MTRHEMENNPIDINVAAGESMNLTALESDACLKERNTAINQINAMMRFKGKAKNDINDKSIYAKIQFFLETDLLTTILIAY